MGKSLVGLGISFCSKTLFNRLTEQEETMGTASGLFLSEDVAYINQNSLLADCIS
jgi:hypothetical protein